MYKKGMGIKKNIALVLAAMMAFSTVPESALQVRAEENESGVIDENDETALEDNDGTDNDSTNEESVDGSEGNGDDADSSQGDSDGIEDSATADDNGENDNNDSNTSTDEDNDDEEGSETNESADENEEELIDEADIVDETDDKLDSSENDGNEDCICLNKSISGYDISVYIPTGVLPDNVELKISKQDDYRALVVEDKIIRGLERGYYIENTDVFDITFLSDGAEVEPKNGSVWVNAVLSENMEDLVDKSETTLQIYHVEEDDRTEQKEILEESDIDIEVNIEDNDDSVWFEGEEFSEYAFVAVTLYSGEDDEEYSGYISDEESVYKVEDSDIQQMGVGGLISTLPSYYVTPTLPNLRNQNPYGTCWAHASLATAEINQMKQGKAEPNYSEAQLAFSTFNRTADPIGGTDGDNTGNSISTYGFDYGGRFDWACNSLATWEGVVSEELVPYGSSTYKSMKTQGLGGVNAYENAAAHLSNAYVVNIKNGSTAAKEAIYQYGAVGISYQTANGYAADVSATNYNRLYNCYYNSLSGTANHAITVVGWDDNFPKEYFTQTPAGDGAWLCRNSWTTAGEGTTDYDSYRGYFWMSYYDKTLEASAYCVLFDDADKYDNNYQYDGGKSDSIVAEKSVANVFTVQSHEGDNYDEILEAIGVNVIYSGCSFDLYIYTDLIDATAEEKGGRSYEKSPMGNTCKLHQEVNLEYAGFNTIELDTPIRLEPGEQFSVVLVDKCPSRYLFVVKESGVSGNTHYGHSFYLRTQYNKADQWISESDNRNYRIKAFTCNVPKEDGESSIVLPTAIQFNDSSLNLSGKELCVGDEYTAEITFVPANTNRTKVNWTSSDLNVATVDTTGKIKAVGVGTATITVKSAECSVSNSFDIIVSAAAEQVESITISSVLTARNIGDEFTLTSNVTPSEYSTQVKWKTSSRAIATVDSSGNVKIKDAGKVTITATVLDKNASVTFTIKPALPPEGTGIINDSGNAVISWTHDSSQSGTDYYKVEMPDGSLSDRLYKSSSSDKITFTDTSNDYSSRLDSGDSVTYILRKYRGEQYSTRNVNVPLCTPYSITYHLGEGTNNSNNPSIHNGESPLKLLPASTSITGRTFEGWYLDENFTQPVPTDTGLGKKNIDLYAKYRPIKYTIQFYYFGNTQSVTLEYGEEYVIPSDLFTENPSYPYYPISRWYYNRNGKHYCDVGETISNLIAVDGNLYFYPEYKPVYRISYSLNGGTNSADNPVIHYGSETITLKPATYTGCIFTGWFLDAAKTNKVPDNWTPGTNNYTVYAGFRPMEYTVNFYYRNRQINSIKLDYFTGCRIDGLGMTYDKGYPVQYWTYEKEENTEAGTTTVTKALLPSDSVYRLTDKDGDIIDLYAYAPYSPDNSSNNNPSEGYLITLANLEGATSPYAGNVIYYTQKTKTFKLKNPSKVGYTFSGWYSDIRLKRKVTSIKKGSKGNRTLYAKWTPIKYKIKFNKNGGSGSTKTMTVTYDKLFNLRANKFKRKGYTFKGWSRTKTGEVVYSNGEQGLINLTTKKNGTITLYAQWEPIPYTITYKNLGENDVDPPVVVNNNPSTYFVTNTFKLQAPTMEGKTFVGWYSDAKCKKKVTAIKKGTIGNKVLYAKWK